MNFWIDLQTHKWYEAIWALIFAMCLVLLFRNRKKWDIRLKSVLIFVGISIVLFYCPLFAYIVTKTLNFGGLVYERVSWLFFTIPIISYTLVKIYFNVNKRKKITLLVIFFVVCILFGESEMFIRGFQAADNTYKLPDEVITISDAITKDAGCYSDDNKKYGVKQVNYDENGDMIKPKVMVQEQKKPQRGDENVVYSGIRQYTSAPRLSYAVIPQSEYYNAGFKLYEKGVPRTQYFVCDNNEVLKKQIEDCGFELLEETDNYLAYKNVKEFTLYFVRHGETEANVNGIFSGRNTDTNLTSYGIKQAKEVGESLSDIHFDSVYVSESSRTKETARNILSQNKNKTPQMVPKAGFNDADLGTIEGTKTDDIYKLYPDFNEDDYLGKVWDRSFVSPIGASSKFEIVTIIENLLYPVSYEAKDGDNILVVGHSSFFWWLQYFFKDEVENLGGLDNANITVLHYNRGIWEIEALNETPSEFKDKE